MEGAILAGNWIISSLKFDDVIKGFAGGEEWGIYLVNYLYIIFILMKLLGTVLKWRSVEHNAEIYALFRMLGTITHDHKWEDNIYHSYYHFNYKYY